MAETEAETRINGRHGEETRREEARQLIGGRETDDEENEKRRKKTRTKKIHRVQMVERKRSQVCLIPHPIRSADKPGHR